MLTILETRTKSFAFGAGFLVGDRQMIRWETEGCGSESGVTPGRVSYRVAVCSWCVGDWGQKVEE